MEVVDVAVVGGGPSGSSAAREAAERAAADRQRRAGIIESRLGGGRDDPDQYGGSGVESRGAGFGGGDFDTGLSHATGGLVQQMKRSGLASKK